MDVATLGFDVDSTPIKSAVNELSRLSNAARVAENATRGISSSTRNISAHEIASMSAAMGAVEKTSLAAQKAFAATTLAAQRMGSVGAASAKALGQSSAMAQQQTRNLMFQFQDIGTMLAAGQSPFMLLAQQLPQITMYGGQLTGVMGALKATFSSLISPLGLATTAFVLLGSYAVSYFSEWFSGGSEANKIIDEQQQLIAKVADRWGEAYPAIKKYNDEIVRAREQSELISVIDMVKTDKLKNVGALIEQVRIESADLDRMLQEAGEEPQVIKAWRDHLENAVKLMGQGQSASGDFNSAIGILSGDIENSANPAIASMIDLMTQLASQSQTTASEIAKVINSAADVQSSLQNVIQLNSFRDKDGTTKQTSQFIPNNPVTPSSRPLVELEGQPWLDKRSGGGTKTSAYDNATSSITEQTRALTAQTAAQATLNPLVSDYSYAVAKAKVETDLLLAAEKDKKAITPELTAQIGAQAESYAKAVVEQNKLTEAQKKSNDTMNFIKNTTAGFLNDLRSGLREGEGFWRSFGTAALGVLDRITDRLLNDVLDAVFKVGSATGGSSGGGIFGSLLGGIGGLFGGGGTFPSAPGGLYANGGTFENGIHGYSNQIVNTPTVFAFAKGTGLMGEAGPEAIMPLSRDGSGRLGVAVYGGSGNAANSNSPQPISISMPISIDATGADAAGLARVERQLAKFKETLPGTIISTIKNAEGRRGL